MLARQCRFEALFHQLLARPAHRWRGWFSSAFTIWLSLHPSPALDVSGLQQDTRPSSKAARSAWPVRNQFMQMAGVPSPVSFTTYFFTLISLAATNRLR